MKSIDEELAKDIVLQKEKERKPGELSLVDIPDNDIDPSAPLGRSRLVEERKQRRDDTLNMASEIGWKNIPIINLPSKGVFYPDGTEISIRAASVQEIRHFSTIDPEDLIDIDDKLNFIIDKCIRIRTNVGIATYKDILEVDRFSLIFAVRELTFKNGENKLQMNMNCPVCGNTDLIDINKNNFNFFTLDYRLEPYFDMDKKSISLKINDGSIVDLYIPTLGVTNYIKNLVRTKQQRKEYFDKTFLKIAPFLFNNWRAISDKTYNKVNEETMMWSVKKMSVVVGVIDLLQESINPNIEHTCTSCGGDVKQPLDFQGGIKSLFLYTDIFGSLL